MKGIIYTIISVLLIASMLTILFTFSSITRSLRDDQSDKIVSDQIHYFEKNIEDDVERAIYIVGRRALIAADEYVVTNGTTLPTPIDKIKVLMQDGTLNGQSNGAMVGNTLGSWIDAINNNAKNTSFNLTLIITGLDVRPYDSFNIKFMTNVTINITEKTGKIRIDKSFEKWTIVSIEDFEDPLAALRTSGNYRVPIKKSLWISNPTLENLVNAITNDTYFPSKNGADFLSRLEGSTTTNYQALAPGATIGLEHFVNIPKLQSIEISQGLPSGTYVKSGKTLVDHLYWDLGAHPGTCVTDANIPSWFRIDNEDDGGQTHAQIYQVTIGACS